MSPSALGTLAYYSLDRSLRMGRYSVCRHCIHGNPLWPSSPSTEHQKANMSAVRDIFQVRPTRTAFLTLDVDVPISAGIVLRK